MGVIREKPTWIKPLARVLEGKPAFHASGRKDEKAGAYFKSDDPMSCFESVAVPKVTVQDYLYFLYSEVREPATWLAVAALILRIKEKGVLPLTPHTAHRVLLAALVVCDKAQCDFPCRNTKYARIGLTNLQDLNELERALLIYVDFTVVIPLSEARAARAFFTTPPEKRTDSISPTKGRLLLPPLNIEKLQRSLF
eukprot:TRINITY_DN1141_c2_g3_i1.p1 TRINITY_DN1141_c2_g3~~TRINITY_DN1141_c2_g3_i1.p1  ORF type:complete len:216 (+),score=50.70 TRINITY_DN1141_c2_g3_i1:62-649(+)